MQWINNNYSRLIKEKIRSLVVQVLAYLLFALDLYYEFALTGVELVRIAILQQFKQQQQQQQQQNRKATGELNNNELQQQELQQQELQQHKQQNLLPSDECTTTRATTNTKDSDSTTTTSTPTMTTECSNVNITAKYPINDDNNNNNDTIQVAEKILTSNNTVVASNNNDEVLVRNELTPTVATCPSTVTKDEVNYDRTTANNNNDVTTSKVVASNDNATTKKNDNPIAVDDDNDDNIDGDDDDDELGGWGDDDDISFTENSAPIDNTTIKESDETNVIEKSTNIVQTVSTTLVTEVDTTTTAAATAIDNTATKNDNDNDNGIDSRTALNNNTTEGTKIAGINQGNDDFVDDIDDGWGDDDELSFTENSTPIENDTKINETTEENKDIETCDNHAADQENKIIAPTEGTNAAVEATTSTDTIEVENSTLDANVTTEVDTNQPEIEITALLMEFGLESFMPISEGNHGPVITVELTIDGTAKLLPDLLPEGATTPTTKLREDDPSLIALAMSDDMTRDTGGADFEDEDVYEDENELNFIPIVDQTPTKRNTDKRDLDERASMVVLPPKPESISATNDEDGSLMTDDDDDDNNNEVQSTGYSSRSPIAMHNTYDYEFANALTPVVDHTPDHHTIPLELPVLLARGVSLGVCPSEGDTTIDMRQFDLNNNDVGDDLDKDVEDTVHDFGPMVDIIPATPLAASSTMSRSGANSLAVNFATLEEDFQEDAAMDETYYGDSTVGGGEMSVVGGGSTLGVSTFYEGWAGEEELVSDDEEVDTDTEDKVSKDIKKEERKKTTFSLDTNTFDDQHVVDHIPAGLPGAQRLADYRNPSMAVLPASVGSGDLVNEEDNDDDIYVNENELTFGKVVDHTPNLPSHRHSEGSTINSLSVLVTKGELSVNDDTYDQTSYGGDSRIENLGDDPSISIIAPTTSSLAATDRGDDNATNIHLVDHTPSDIGSPVKQIKDPSVEAVPSEVNTRASCDADSTGHIALYGPMVDHTPSTPANVGVHLRSDSVVVQAHDLDTVEETTTGRSSTGNEDDDDGYVEDDIPGDLPSCDTKLVDHVPLRSEPRVGDASVVVAADPSEVLSEVDDLAPEEQNFGPVVDVLPFSRISGGTSTEPTSGIESTGVLGAPSIATDDLDEDDMATVSQSDLQVILNEDVTVPIDAATPNPQSGNDEAASQPPIHVQLVDFLPPVNEAVSTDADDAAHEGFSELTVGGAQSLLQTGEPVEDDFGPVVDLTPFLPTELNNIESDGVVITTREITRSAELLGKYLPQISEVVGETLPRLDSYRQCDSNATARPSVNSDADDEDEDDASYRYGPVVDHLPTSRASLAPSGGGSTVDALAYGSEGSDDNDADEEGVGWDDVDYDASLGCVSEVTDRVTIASARKLNRQSLGSGDLEKTFSVRFDASIKGYNDTNSVNEEQSHEETIEIGRIINDIASLKSTTEEVAYVEFLADKSFAEADTPPSTPYRRLGSDPYEIETSKFDDSILFPTIDKALSNESYQKNDDNTSKILDINVETRKQVENASRKGVSSSLPVKLIECNSTGHQAENLSETLPLTEQPCHSKVDSLEQHENKHQDLYKLEKSTTDSKQNKSEPINVQQLQDSFKASAVNVADLADTIMKVVNRLEKDNVDDEYSIRFKEEIAATRPNHDSFPTSNDFELATNKLNQVVDVLMHCLNTLQGSIQTSSHPQKINIATGVSSLKESLPLRDPKSADQNIKATMEEREKGEDDWRQEKLENNLIESKLSIDSLNESLHKKEEEVINLNEEKVSLNETLIQLTSKYRLLEDENAGIKTKLEEATDKLQQLTEESKNYWEEIKNLNSMLDKEEKKRKQLEQDNDELIRVEREVTSKRYSDLEKSLNKNAFTFEQNVKELKNRCSALEMEASKNEIMIRDLQAKLTASEDLVEKEQMHSQEVVIECEKLKHEAQFFFDSVESLKQGTTEVQDRDLSAISTSNVECVRSLMSYVKGLKGDNAALNSKLLDLSSANINLVQSVDILKDEKASLMKVIQENECGIETLERKLREIEQNNITLQQSIDLNRSENMTLISQMEALQSEAGQLEVQLDAIKIDLLSSNERVKAMTDAEKEYLSKSEQMQAAVRNLEQSLQEKEAIITKLDTDVVAANSKFEEISNCSQESIRVAEKEYQIKSKEMQTTVKNLEFSLKEKENTIAKLEEEVAAANSKFEEMSSRSEEARRFIEKEHQLKSEEMQTSVKNLELSLKEKESTITKLETEVAAANSKFEEMSSRSEEARRSAETEYQLKSEEMQATVRNLESSLKDKDSTITKLEVEVAAANSNFVALSTRSKSEITEIVSTFSKESEMVKTRYKIALEDLQKKKEIVESLKNEIKSIKGISVIQSEAQFEVEDKAFQGVVIRTREQQAEARDQILEKCRANKALLSHLHESLQNRDSP